MPLNIPSEQELARILGQDKPNDVKKRKRLPIVERYEARRRAGEPVSVAPPPPPPPPVRGPLGNAAAAAGSGVVGAGEMIMRAARTAGLPTGEAVDYLSGLRQSPALSYPREGLAGQLYQGVEGAPQSIGIGVPGALVGSVGGVPGMIGGFALGGGTIAGMAQYDEFIHEADRLGIPREVSRDPAIKSALAEGTLESVAKVVDVLATRGAAGMAARSLLAKYVTTAGKVAVGEVGTEMAQAYIGAGQRQKAGLPTPPPAEAAKQAIIPSIVTAGIIGAGATGIGHAAGRKKPAVAQEPPAPRQSTVAPKREAPPAQTPPEPPVGPSAPPNAPGATIPPPPPVSPPAAASTPPVAAPPPAVDSLPRPPIPFPLAPDGRASGAGLPPLSMGEIVRRVREMHPSATGEQAQTYLDALTGGLTASGLNPDEVGAAMVADVRGPESAPAQGALTQAAQAPADPFFHTSERVISEKMPARMPALALRSWLQKQGVKPEEMKWTGLDDFLSQQRPVTREEALDFIRQNAVRSGINVREIAKPDSITERAADVFGRQMASSMPLQVADGGVLSALKHDQILGEVVANLPVDVVDNLSSIQISPEQLLRDPDVVFEQLPADHRLPVARGVLAAMRQVGTRLRAELLHGLDAGGDVEVLPALRASELDTREVVGLLSPESIYHVGLSIPAGGADVTGARAVDSLPASNLTTVDNKRLPASSAEFLDTELPAGIGTVPSSSSATGLDAESRPARIADALDWHASIIPDAGTSRQARAGGAQWSEGQWSATTNKGLEFEAIQKNDEIAGGRRIDAYTPSGEYIGGARFFQNDDGTWSAANVYVNPPFQRQGIATAIYDRAESLGMRLVPSGGAYGGKLSPDGQALWESRRRRQSVMQGQPLFQGRRGQPGANGPRAQVEYLDDWRAIITFLQTADFSSIPHEFAHPMRLHVLPRILTREEMDRLARWCGVPKDADWFTGWSREAEEKFAHGYERYLYEGKAPARLRAVFEKIAQWMREVYTRLQGSQIDVDILPVRDIYDILTFGPEARTQAWQQEVYGQQPAPNAETPWMEPLDEEPAPEVTPEVAEQPVVQEAPVATTPALEGEREPWQMTREEWRKTVTTPAQRAAATRASKSLERAKAELARWREQANVDSRSGRERFAPDVYQENRRKLAAARRRVENLERAIAEAGNGPDVRHRTAVERALREGKPVPPEVLAEYPELQPQAAPPAPQRPKLEPAGGGDDDGQQAAAVPARNIEGTGKSAIAKTRDMQVATRYAVVEAGDVLESTDPGYLRELQPRDTDRAAREGRVGEIAAKLDPEMLGENPLASDGAPIVGPDAMVETGNTRVAALRRVYSSGTENASRYRSWLVESADRFGLDRAQIEAMQSPVLVRVRETPLDDAKRVEFVRQANESTTARMSSSEQAQVDADLLTPDLMGVFNPSEDGDVATESNLEFTREFLRRLGSRESAALVTADGRLNTDGIRRIRNAVFAKAYGNAEVIARLAEDPDDAIKNVTKAMLLAVHRLAAVRSSVEQGNLHNIDLTPALAEAAGKLAALREQGIPVERYLAERGLFGEELSQEAKVLLALFDRNKRSAKRIASYLTTFADGVEARGNPQNRSMFGDDTVPTVGEVLAAAIRKVDREHGAEGVAGSSGAPGGLFEGQDLGGRSTGAGAGGFAQQIADAVWNSPIRPPGAGQAASEELTPPRDPSAPLFQAANIGLTPQQHRQRILEGYDAGKFTLDTPGLPESVAAFVRRERPDGPQRPVEPSPGPATAPNAPEAGSAPAAPETEQVQGGTNLATVAAYRERTGREERPAVTPDTNAAQIARGREIAAAPERVDAIINRGVAGQQLTADEQAALGVVMDDAEARADAIRERARTLPEGSREWRAAMEEWEAADARVFRMGLAVENTGTAIARALQFRAARFLNHFDYHRVIHRATVANGGDALNAEQRAAFDDLTRRLAEADQRLADALAEGRDLRAALAETRRGAEEAARRFERETRQRERKPAPRQGERPPRPKPTQEQKDAKRLERLRDRRKEIIARLRESGLQPREGVRILNQDGRFTPAFWRWFGESKVVDDQGQPLVVYHGTDASFSEFGVGRRSTEDMHPGGPIGHFFTAEPDVAGDYADYASFSRTGDVKGPNGQNIIPVHLSIQNPYEVSGYEWDRGDFIPEGSSPEDVISIRSDLQAEGYDGLIIRRSYGTEYVAFSPTQIKSAIGNAGTYDPTNPSILHQDAPASAIPGLTPKQVADLYALSRVLIEEQIASGGAVDLDGVAEGIREAFPMLDDLQVWEAIRGPRKGRAKPDLPGRKEMIERDSLRHEINRRVEVIKFARLPRGAKLLYGAAHAGNAMRSMMASFDMSWLLRQGAVLATAHPGIARRAFGESLRAWADADTARAAYLELTELPQNLDAMTPQQGVHALRILRRTNAGLQLTDPEGTMIEREEDFATNFFSRLKRIPGLALYVKGIEGSERAYSTGLNKLRADTFDHYADLLDEQGAATPENLRALANYINIATGRGNLGSLAPAARQLAAVFFAPRYAISRFQLLGTLVRAPAPVRALIARDLVRWFGANMGILSLAVLAGASVEWDPRNSDWGQIRIGNSRADLWAGFRQVGVALARLVTGKIAYTEGGQNIERATQRDRVIMRFVQSKLSPLTSLMWEAIEGRTFTYKPFEWGPAIVERTIPIGAREMPETLKERGPVGGAALSALNLLGVGVNTYDNRASSHRRPENDSRVMTADEYARYLGAGGPRTR